MRKVLLLSCYLMVSAVSFGQAVADFENLNLPPDSFWNGSAEPLGTQFTSGAALFPNYYDTSFGGFWSQGWAYSTMRDTMTGDFTNLYSAITYDGFDQSATYAVGQNNSIVNLDLFSIGKIVAGFYVTNSTYAYKSMKNGDAFAKQFGGPTGDDPDFFLLTIKGWFQGVPIADSVDFYLADYRFADNNLDYIVDSWEWVDLSGLGNVDSLSFTLTSSDVGSDGMNTPGFFCIDNFTTENSGVHVAEFNAVTLKLYPNPTTDYVWVEGITQKAAYSIINQAGQVLQSAELVPGSPIDITSLTSGQYFMVIQNGIERQVKKIIRL